MWKSFFTRSYLVVYFCWRWNDSHDNVVGTSRIYSVYECPKSRMWSPDSRNKRQHKLLCCLGKKGKKCSRRCRSRSTAEVLWEGSSSLLLLWNTAPGAEHQLCTNHALDCENCKEAESSLSKECKTLIYWSPWWWLYYFILPSTWQVDTIVSVVVQQQNWMTRCRRKEDRWVKIIISLMSAAHIFPSFLVLQK